MKNEVDYCKSCEEETLHICELVEKGPHYGKKYCSKCGRLWGWLRKPENEGKRGKSKYTPQDLGTEYCQFCMRERDNLINSETLEIHHVQEISNHGSDSPENIMVACTYCHRLIHMTRTYIRRADGNYKKNP